MTANRHNSIFYGVDLWTVLLYVLIVMAGWVSITSASYDEGTADVFSFSHFYMKQLMWIGVAWTTAVVVLLLDDRLEMLGVDLRIMALVETAVERIPPLDLLDDMRDVVITAVGDDGREVG